MNRIILILILSLISVYMFAQEKSYDIVLKLNSEEHIGTVTEMDDNFVKFVQKGESLNYVF